LGTACISAGAICFSLAIIFIRSISGISVATLTFFRSLAAFLFFCALALRTPRMRQLRRYRADVPALLALGLTLSATALLYVTAVRLTTAANAVLLNNTAPLYVALLAPALLEEARPRRTWLSLTLALVGIVLVTGVTELRLTRGAWRGILAGALSGVTLALTLLGSRRLGRNVDGLTQTWWGTGVATLLTLPMALATPWSAIAPNLWLLAGMGVFAFGLPYLLYFRGLEQVDAQVASIVALLEPVSGVLIGMLLYGEVPTLLGGLGILMILTSIVLISN
jgi:drug/metabolite transporter (DMT)-like permease